MTGAFFFKKMGGTLSGPPEDLAFNLRKTNATLVVVNVIFDCEG